MRLALVFALIWASVSSAAENTRDIFCYGEYVAGVPFYSFKVKCDEGRVYEKRAFDPMPSAETLIGIQKTVVTRMSRDGFQLIESFRSGQILIFKKPAHANGDSERQLCISNSKKLGFIDRQLLPESAVMTRWGIVDCSEGMTLNLDGTQDFSADDMMEQNGIHKVSQVGSVGIYQK